MGEGESEGGNRRLQERSESRRDVLLAPKQQAIVQTKRKDASDGKQDPISASPRQRQPASLDNGKEDCRSDYKPDAGKRKRRQVVEAKFYE